ncbi:MAG: leucine-rich repeat domain-containing protein [Oscillospiraceae bacterium]|nr:leucine-rich repeat domain-containing protein [Oscillospiraceae bacterium]
MEDKTVKIKDYVFRLNDDRAVLTAWNKNRASVELPNRVEGVPVRDIDPDAFEGCESLRDISLPMELAHLPLTELRRCRSLEAIRVSPLHAEFSSQDGILYNKEKTELLDCPIARSKAVRVPETVKKIVKSAFSGCEKLREINLPAHLETIEDYAFAHCKSLHSMALPDSLSFIGPHALTACRQLRALHLSSNITEPPVLNGCKSLRAITVSAENPALSSRNGVLFNADGTELRRCPQGKTGKLVIPAETQAIAADALSGCGGLTEIRVAEGNSAFSDQDGVLFDAERTRLICCPAGYGGTLMLGEEVTEIGPDAFPVQLLPIVMDDGSGSITRLWIEGAALNEICTANENAVFSSENGVLYNKDKTVLLRCPGGYRGRLTLPDTVREIADSAMRGCSELTALNLPDGLRRIGDAALEGCFQLERLVIPEGTGEIGEGAMTGCVHMTDVFIRGRQTAVGHLAFDCCANLTVHAPADSPAAQYAAAERLNFRPILGI